MDLNYEDFDFEKLIDIIRPYHAIWNTGDPDYSDKIKKENCWTEVCKSYFDDTWDSMPSINKKQSGLDVKKKWGNLRDSYRKYKLKLKKNSGAGANRVKKYIYADFLTFLDTTFEQRETDSNYRGHVSDESSVNNSLIRPISDVDNNSEKNIRKKKTKKNEESDEAQSILDFIKLKSNSEDEDYHFMMSLVPEIKRVPSQYKLKLKSEMNLLISKYQCLSQINSPQSNISCIPPYSYNYNQSEHDGHFSLLKSQSHQPFPPNYNQTTSNHHNYQRTFTNTQPSTSALFNPIQINPVYTEETSNIAQINNYDHLPQTASSSYSNSPQDLTNI